MALPNQLKTARMTDATIGSDIDNYVGDLEQAICDILGLTINTNVTETHFGMDNSGRVTKALIRQLAAPPVGWRFRDSSNGKEFRLALSNNSILIDENTGSEGTPTWTNRVTISLTNGLVSLAAGTDPSGDNDLTRKAYVLAAIASEVASQVGTAISTHDGTATVHAASTNLEKVANKNATNGYCGLDGSTLVPTNKLGTGTPSSSNFLRGDRSWAAMADPDSLRKSAYMRYSDHKAAGTDGGSTVTGAWYARDLNTEDADYGSLGSVANNKVTLGAGTYYFRVYAPFRQCGAVRLRLYNSSDATPIQTSQNMGSTTEQGLDKMVLFAGYFTIGASKDIQIQYRCTTAITNTGLGCKADFGEDEIYTVLELWKV